jgi:polyhydroxybutyrate depolymerase
MAFRVGAELSDRVAAIAPVAGASWAETVSPERAVSVLYLTGTADPLNPMQGGFPRFAIGGRDQGGRAKPPVGVEISRWARALSCPDAPPREREENGVRIRRYPGCRDGAEIVFITVDGLGHVWAGGKSLLPEFVVGKPTDKLKATDVIWEFFRSHPAHRAPPKSGP